MEQLVPDFKLYHVDWMALQETRRNVESHPVGVPLSDAMLYTPNKRIGFVDGKKVASLPSKISRH